jgi:hypothetical protein
MTHKATLIALCAETVFLSSLDHSVMLLAFEAVSLVVSLVVNLASRRYARTGKTPIRKAV